METNEEHNITTTNIHAQPAPKMNMTNQCDAKHPGHLISPDERLRIAMARQ